MSRSERTAIKRIQLPQARILVVDDFVTNLDVIKGVLEMYGMQVDCVVSGAEAINRLMDTERHYHAVFMDHMMPDLDGTETMQQIRDMDTEYAKTVPIFMVTANVSEGNELKFLSQGFQAYMSKPIDLMLIDELIHTWVVPQFAKAEDHRNEHSLTPISSIRLEDIHIEGIDTAMVMILYENDILLYSKILQSFVQNTPAVVEALRQVSLKSMKEYTIQVHGIKGACNTIAAVDLSMRAYTLEIKTKRDTFTAQAYQEIALENDFLLTELQLLCKRIQMWLDTMDLEH